MARLTAKKRDDLKKATFAIPSERKYPLTDVKHARNALARVSQNGSPAEIAKVRKKVAERFPSIAVTGAKKGKKGK